MNQPLQSETVAKVAVALAKAQAKIHHAHFDSNNPAFKSKYASLESVIDATKTVLLGEDIVVVQQPTTDEHGVILVTTLLHTSGEWLRSYLPVINEKGSAQSQGSGLTYSRRYALASMMNIGQADDDGNAASASKPKDPNVIGVISKPGAKTAITLSTKWPFPYPEGCQGRAISDFATDEKLNAEKSLSRWKLESSKEGYSKKPFPKDGDEFIELLRSLMRKTSAELDMDNDLDRALSWDRLP